jgi:hypothetical protein
MAYIRRTALEEASSRDYMHRTLKCKPCPECGLATEKNRGCNHMAVRFIQNCSAVALLACNNALQFFSYTTVIFGRLFLKIEKH